MERASKSIISNLKKQKRENKFLLFLDNVKIVKDALASGKIEPLCILCSHDELPKPLAELFQNQNKIGETAKTDAELVGGLIEKNPIENLDDVPIYRVDEATISQLSGTVTSQHIICVAMLRPTFAFEFSDSNFLILDGLQDPGNVGTMIRTALAAGYENVILIESVKLNNDKLIRSSAGAVFSVNAVEMTREEFVSFAKKSKLNLLCTDMNGENIFQFDKNKMKTPFGVVVGNEGQGVSSEVEKLCKTKVSIPMCGGIESLNAGVSGAIVMYLLSNFNKFEK